MRARVTAPSIVSFLRMSTAAFSEPPIQSAPPQSDGSSRPVEKLEVAEAAPHVTVQLYSVSVLSVRPAGSGTNCVALPGAFVVSYCVSNWHQLDQLVAIDASLPKAI